MVKIPKKNKGIKKKVCIDQVNENLEMSRMKVLASDKGLSVSPTTQWLIPSTVCKSHSTVSTKIFVQTAINSNKAINLQGLDHG